ncbi:MAG TPA: hypothetical protein VGR45_01995 [Stellaceae bacterium]|nr:hypothetical protein [Stellaceae bacterium]
MTTKTALAFGAQVRKPAPSGQTVAPMALFRPILVWSTAMQIPGENVPARVILP